MGRRKQQQEHDPATFKNQTPFRLMERKYKNKNRRVDTADLIDFTNLENNTSENAALIHEVGTVSLDHEYFVKAEHKVYELEGYKGLLYIPNPFNDQSQAMFSFKALKEYTRRPNVSNLDTHWIIGSDGVLDGCVQNSVYSKKPEDFNATSGIGAYRSEQKDEEQPSENDAEQRTISADILLKRLRWITIGMQFDWYTKQYKNIENAIEIPKELADISIYMVKMLGDLIYYRPGAKGAGIDMEGDEPEKYCERRKNAAEQLQAIQEQDCSVAEIPLVRGYYKPYKPEAGIVNFYQINDALTGHVDRSELNMEAPLVSLSFGHSCVYLIGTATREDYPRGIMIRSGDILLLSGDARRAFHGVPRIIEDTLPDLFKDKSLLENLNVSDTEKELYIDFMSKSRINMNVRQVF
ncbi:hypothetical protein MP638_000630 [Amoeboaphelidium occidentale]|nr:hypothetical protein MP638_000630 [Amoeboaphelidium occidentale]